MTVRVRSVEESRLPELFRDDPELLRKKQVVDIANRMAQKSATGVASLKSAFATQGMLMDESAVKGRRAISQQAELGIAGGANRGLRSNVASANDAAIQMQPAVAGFESQIAQLRGNLGVQEAMAVGPAELDALGQEMTAVEKAQELNATEGGQLQAANTKFDNMLSDPNNQQKWYELDGAYGRRMADIAVKEGIIPDTPEARAHYGARAEHKVSTFAYTGDYQG